jgi:predicted dehydrogenase
MKSEGISRRHFFIGSLLAGAVPIGGFGRTPSLRQMGYKSPNEKLNIASIGAGGQAEIDIEGCSTENIVALADPDDARAAASFQKYEKAARYRDFRRMLDKEAKSIDAVIITTPDHTHAVAATWCMQRGKHVYVQKPLTHSIWEARVLTEAAAKYKVATQMGNQGYSTEGARIAAEIIWSGEIGNIREVHSWTDRPIWPQGIATLPPEEQVPATLDWDVWLGPKSMRPYSSAYLPFKWRGWYDFGTGALGDIACHALGVVNIALRLGAPTSVEVVRQEGKNVLTFPNKSVVHFDFPARGSMPPVRIIWYDGVKEPPFRPPQLPAGEPLISGSDAFGAGGADYGAGVPGGTRGLPGQGGPPGGAAGGQSVFARNREASGAIFMGDKGILTTDQKAYNVRLLPLSRHKEYRLPPQILTRSPGHYRDWIRACKGGDPACSNFSISGPFTEWVQLGSLALRLDARLEWDSARMRVTNHREANNFIKPTYRKGWEIQTS